MINLYTAWVWVDFTHYAEIYPLILLRDVHRAITEIRDKMGVKRLQAYVECDFEAGIKMVEKLGFVRESSMAAFAGKNDAYMYVRFL
jgi:L-amino acid N-acyltransferase YncA